MEQPIRIKGPKKALTKIKQIAHENFRSEICGFLGFDEDKKEYLIQLEQNVSEDPSNFFLINPLSYLLFKDDYQMIAILKEMRTHRSLMLKCPRTVASLLLSIV